MDHNRFDVSTKELIWDDPAAWLLRLGITPHGPVEVIDSDITTLSAAADKVIRVGGPEPFLVNIELQSSHETDLMRTLWFRQVALDYRHDLPVLTVLVLLRKEANSPSFTGNYERSLPDGRLMNRYHYQVVRLWKEPAESFLNAGVELVPLAPLGEVDETQLPELVRKMAERINRLPPPRASKLWTALYLLMGLRYPDELISELLEGVQAVKESVTYQKILRDGRIEGRLEGRTEGRMEGRTEGRTEGLAEGLAEGRTEGGENEARRIVVRHGTKRLGHPSAAILEVLEAINDIDRLENLLDRILDNQESDWESIIRTN